MRTRGMSLMRMPLSVGPGFHHCNSGAAFVPVLLGGGILLLLDRMAGTSFFYSGGLYVSAGTVPLHNGRSPLLWQHLFGSLASRGYIASCRHGGYFHILSTFARNRVWLSRHGLCDFRDWMLASLFGAITCYERHESLLSRASRS